MVGEKQYNQLGTPSQYPWLISLSLKPTMKKNSQISHAKADMHRYGFANSCHVLSL